jgi:hypothetical protein
MKKQFVQLNPKSARWHLDHPEIYEVPGSRKVDLNYENDTLIHLMCCLGEPVYGEVVTKTHSNPDTWRVKFKIADLEMQYCVEREHVTFLNRQPRVKPVNEIETLTTNLNNSEFERLSLVSEVESLRTQNLKLNAIVNKIREEVLSIN